MSRQYTSVHGSTAPRRVQTVYWADVWGLRTYLRQAGGKKKKKMRYRLPEKQKCRDLQNKSISFFSEINPNRGEMKTRSDGS